MPVSILQPSFAAGELSPNLFARVDLAKYKVGAANLHNFFVDFRGGASNRAGTLYVTQPKAVAGQPRLIPFVVSQTSSYVLLFGAGYIWFVQNGALVMHLGLPLEVATPYAAADLSTLKYTQSADVMTLVHPSYPPATLTLASGTFTYTAIVTGAKVLPPTSLSATATVNSDYSYGYVVTAISVDGKDESLPCAPAICECNFQDESKGFQVNLSWTAPAGGFSEFRIYKWGPTDRRQGPPQTIWGYIGSAEAATFTDNNIAPDYTQQPPSFGDPFSPGQFQSIRHLTPGAGYAAFTYQALSISGDGTGAAGYAVINSAGQVNGVFLTNAGKNYTHATITCGAGGATFSATFSSTSPLYPAAAIIAQQRVLYGGANTQPSTISASRTGVYTNFNSASISQATDAFAFDIASSEVNTIKAFANVSYGTLAFTSGGTFLLNGGGQNQALTPSSISSQAQASNGINDMPPLSINYSILYVQNRGNIVRDLSFAWQRQSYTGNDISTFANHLFYNKTLTEWSWCEEPNKLVWVVRSDGVLLCLTYVPEQEIYAWSHHDTNGWFRSVCSIPEGGSNITYVIVERAIGGAFQYYVERFNPRIFDAVEDAWFVDSGLSLAQHTDTEAIMLVSQVEVGSASITALTGAGYVFPMDVVGYTFWGPGNIPGTYGKATITSRFSDTEVGCTILSPFARQPDDAGLDDTAPCFPGTWQLNPTLAAVPGPAHLVGQIITGLADGLVIEPFTYTGGDVTLPWPSSKVTIGLGYTCDLTTLRLDTGEPTTQGKRKLLPTVTLILDKSVGLSCGGDPDHLDNVPETQIPYTPPVQLFSGESFLPIPGQWDTAGQIYIRQAFPLPATILGVVPNVEIGDDR